jgi:hypothetical protein
MRILSHNGDLSFQPTSCQQDSIFFSFAEIYFSLVLFASRVPHFSGMLYPAAGSGEHIRRDGFPPLA